MVLRGWAMGRPRLESLVVGPVLGLGLLLPWLVGIGMKLYLDARGEPTWDWLYFLHPGRLALELWATLWLAAPSLVLALVARLLFRDRLPGATLLSPAEKAAAILVAAAWGAAGSLPVLIALFRDFHPVSFLVPFFHTLLYLDDYLLGLAAGALLAVTGSALRHRRHRRSGGR